MLQDLQIAKSAGTAAGPNHSQDASSDEEDAEDSSSSSLNQVRSLPFKFKIQNNIYFPEQQSVENALTIFRNNWKSELRNSSKNQQKLSTEAKRRGVGNDESTQEDIVETVRTFSVSLSQNLLYLCFRQRFCFYEASNLKNPENCMKQFSSTAVQCNSYLISSSV